MDFLSDNLVYVVFVVIAITLQIGRLFIRRAGERKKQERREEGEGQFERPPDPAFYRGRDYREGESEGGEDGGDGEFSAWNLSVDDEPAPAVPAPPAPAAAKYSVAAPLSDPVPAPFSAPLFAPVSAPARDSSPFPGIAAGAVSGFAAGAGTRGAGGIFPPSVSSMPEAGASVNNNGRSGDPGNARSGPGFKRGAVSAGFPERLGYLPPLKRAVVLAEILGTPKGL
ncbi:MAG: hypothetical protein LBI91_01965 [Spirochaetaceae bacterium]|jgi:hypothetical protein|nr:hypothetical protein [Spirochaetaceae bacterium]